MPFLAQTGFTSVTNHFLQIVIFHVSFASDFQIRRSGSWFRYLFASVALCATLAFQLICLCAQKVTSLFDLGLSCTFSKVSTLERLCRTFCWTGQANYHKSSAHPAIHRQNAGAHYCVQRSFIWTLPRFFFDAAGVPLGCLRSIQASNFRVSFAGMTSSLSCSVFL